MKNQPLPLTSVVDLWPWVHLSLGFLTSVGGLSQLRCFALSSLYEGKTRIQQQVFPFLSMVCLI